MVSVDWFLAVSGVLGVSVIGLIIKIFNAGKYTANLEGKVESQGKEIKELKSCFNETDKNNNSETGRVNLMQQNIENLEKEFENRKPLPECSQLFSEIRINLASLTTKVDMIYSEIKKNGNGTKSA